MRTLLNKYILLVLVFILMFSSYSFADKYDQYFQKAVNLAREGNPSEGERILSTAISRNQRSVKLYLYRGKFKQKYTHNKLSAIADYNIIERLVSVPPIEMYWYRGMCYYDLKIYQQSIIDYSKAIRIKPSWGKMYYYRSKAYAKIGMTDRAINDLKKLVKYDPKYKKKAEILYNKILMGKHDF